MAQLDHLVSLDSMDINLDDWLFVEDWCIVENLNGALNLNRYFDSLFHGHHFVDFNYSINNPVTINLDWALFSNLNNFLLRDFAYYFNFFFLFQFYILCDFHCSGAFRGHQLLPYTLNLYHFFLGVAYQYFDWDLNNF